jgi:adenosylhomocysteine nucleosidase
MNRVAIIAAMPGELKPLVRGWQRERRNGVDLWRWSYLDDEGDEGEWMAACAGAGVDAATRAFAEVERDGAPNLVISVGWAGALSEEFVPGRAYLISGVVDARTGERFPSAEWPEEGPQAAESLQVPGPWLVTSPRVADQAEKRRLEAAYGASLAVGLVDMEAAGVARLAQMRGIPFYCVKGISDGYNDQLPDFNRFITANGQFQLGRFLVSRLLRPWQWPALMRMGENSRKAAQGIAESLLDVLDERGRLRRRNGYPNFTR